MQIILVLAGLAAAVWLGLQAAGGGQAAVIVAVGTMAVALFAFFSPRLSLVFLVFSMLLSPELGLGAVDPSRSLVIRYDDIFIVVIFLSWFARAAIFKHKPFITSTPVQTPVLLYTALCVVSTALGVMRGDLRWSAASLYVLKYIEYFLLYFMAVNIIESKEDVYRYLKVGLVVAAIVTVYAYYYYYASGIEARATAPFEAPIGNPRESEPASLGGYYLIVYGVLLALISEGGWRASLLSLSAILLSFPAFLFTYSRASYIGFAAMIPAMFALSRKRRLLMAGVLAAGAIGFMLSPTVKGKVMDRIRMTYSGVYATHSFDTGIAGQVKLEESAAARVWSIKKTLLLRLPERPLLGWGVTGIGVGDTQYSLVLGELGLLGAVLFIWMIYRLFFTAKEVFRSYGEPVIRALSLGFMISLCGLLFQALGVNTFIIVRIMEPFWFIAAMLGVLYLKRPQAQKEPA